MDSPAASTGETWGDGAAPAREAAVAAKKTMNLFIFKVVALNFDVAPKTARCTMMLTTDCSAPYILLRMRKTIVQCFGRRKAYSERNIIAYTKPPRKKGESDTLV